MEISYATMFMNVHDQATYRLILHKGIFILLSYVIMNY